jgi:hypothetical protein
MDAGSSACAIRNSNACKGLTHMTPGPATLTRQTARALAARGPAPAGLSIRLSDLTSRGVRLESMTYEKTRLSGRIPDSSFIREIAVGRIGDFD